MDKIRVLRIIEYVGDRDLVEKLVSESIHGEKIVYKGKLVIKAATMGTYPETLEISTVADNNINLDFLHGHEFYNLLSKFRDYSISLANTVNEIDEIDEIKQYIISKLNSTNLK